ncbi:MAG TPA: hypothetical protein VF700_07005, partial [Segetibacter sp.]
MQLHRVFSPLTGLLLNLVYMTRLSKWVYEHKDIEYNDFLSKWDYNKRYGMYKWVIEKENLTGPLNYLEFGVANGKSFNWFMTQNAHE